MTTVTDLTVAELDVYLRLYARILIPVRQHANYYLSKILNATEFRPPLAYGWFKQSLIDVRDFVNKCGNARPLDEIERSRVNLAEHVSTVLLATTSPTTVEQCLERKYNDIDRLSDVTKRRIATLKLTDAQWCPIKLSSTDDSLRSWDDLCAARGVHVALARSRSFRQSVLGLVSYRSSKAAQSRIIDEVMRDAADASFAERVVNRDSDGFSVLVECQKHLDAVTRATAVCQLPARCGLIEYRQLAFSRGYTQFNYDTSGLWDSTKVESVQPFRVPANLFHIWLTRVVFNMVVFDQRDTLFFNEGHVARWQYDFNREPAHRP